MGMKIKKIEYLSVEEPAYDITVKDEAHTFPLSSGVYVHNSMRVPKQYFGETDDAAGFNGGSSLSIISSRYAKAVKRIQNTIIQAITDAINLMLLDKGLDAYINKFSIHMLPPTTQEEIDRRDNLNSKIGMISDIMNTMSDIEDTSLRLKILKTLLSNAISDTEVIATIQEQIDLLSNENGIKTQEKDNNIENEEDSFISEPRMGDSNKTRNDIDSVNSMDLDNESEIETEPEDKNKEMTLPTPADLGKDFSDNEQF